MLRWKLVGAGSRRAAELPLVALIVLVQPVLAFTLLGCDGQLGGLSGSGRDTDNANSAAAPTSRLVMPSARSSAASTRLCRGRSIAAQHVSLMRCQMPATSGRAICRKGQ